MGNQIIQISFAMRTSGVAAVNTNATRLRKQLKEIDRVRYKNTLFINYLFGGIRKLLSLIKSRAVDITLCKVVEK